jgi:hypothetical protein
LQEFLTSFYYENFINFGMGPKAHGDGPKSITFPIADSKMCINAVEDIGKFGAKIFEDESLIGKQVGVQSSALTGNEIAAVFEDVLGEKVVYNSVPRDVYAGFGFPGAEDLANMFQFFHEDAKVRPTLNVSRTRDCFCLFLTRSGCRDSTSGVLWRTSRSSSARPWSSRTG